MPPLPPVSKVVRVKMVSSIGTDIDAESRLFFTYTGGPPTGPDLTSLATAIRSAWSTNLASLYPSGFGLQAVHVLDLDSTSGLEGVNTTAVSGTRTGSALPAGSAMLINGKIARRYRGGKPRVYIPFGVTSDLSTPSQWGGTWLSNVTSSFTAFITAVKALSEPSIALSDNVNVSYYLNKILRTTPAQDAIISWTANPIPGSQRRRYQRI